MPRIYKRLKTYRTIFRKLGFGAMYWLSASRTIAPSIKSTRTSKQGGETVATGTPTNTAEANTAVAVVRVPRQFVHLAR